MSHFLNCKEINPVQKLTLPDAFAAITQLRNQVSDLNAYDHLVAQENLRDRLLTALILGSHCLIEGYPGLAKTYASELLGARSGLMFRRAQFTPDMMPSDLLFSERIAVDEAGKSKMDWIPGPIFTNIFLADEINRASPKIQAAMLEATQEKRVTLLRGQRRIIRPEVPVDEAELLGKHGPYFGALRKFDPLTHEGQHFMALATMNPLEQEGVFPLSEAQLDRFTFKLIVDYPERAHFDAISVFAFDRPRPANNGSEGGYNRSGTSTGKTAAWEEDHVKTLYFLSALRDLLVGSEAMARWQHERNRPLRTKLHAFVEFSHLGYKPSAEGEESDWAPDTFLIKSPAIERARQFLGDLRRGSESHLREVADCLDDKLRDQSYPEVTYGASPRTLLNLIRAAHVQAFLKGRINDGFVTPQWDDFDEVAADIMRHRIRVAASSSAIGLRSIDAVEKLREAFLVA